jgi:hypothetical protein
LLGGMVVVVGFGCLFALGWFPFGGFWGLVVEIDVVLLLLLDLWSEVLVVVDEGVEAAAADFLLCNGGLVVLVLVFALLETDGALVCRASFAGAAPFILMLAVAAAVEAVVLPDETTPPLTDCFGWLISGLILGSLVLSAAPEFSLSALRRAGFFLGFLVVVGSGGS